MLRAVQRDDRDFQLPLVYPNANWLGGGDIFWINGLNPLVDPCYSVQFDAYRRQWRGYKNNIPWTRWADSAREAAADLCKVIDHLSANKDSRPLPVWEVVDPHSHYVKVLWNGTVMSARRDSESGHWLGIDADGKVVERDSSNAPFSNLGHLLTTLDFYR